MLTSKNHASSKWWQRIPGGQLTLLEPLGDLARGQPSPIDPGGLAGEVLLFIKSYGTNGDSSSLKPLEIAPTLKKKKSFSPDNSGYKLHTCKIVTRPCKAVIKHMPAYCSLMLSYPESHRSAYNLNWKVSE